MAEVVIGIIQFLVDKLLTLSKEQIDLVRNFEDDLENLQTTFSMVKGVLLDAENRQVTDIAVKRWLRQLEDLAYEADNVIDEIDYHRLSGEINKDIEEPNSCGRAMKRFKGLFFGPSHNPITFRQKLGNDIKVIIEKFVSINQTARMLDVPNIAAQAPFYVASASRQTDSFKEEPIFLGREEDMSSIMDTLITAEQKLTVLPIVGMGGQGKTTLARKVFNHEQIESHFGDNRVWVHVPRILDVVGLFKRILTSINEGNHVEHANREALVKMLKKQLGAKKYLLLLDDVWNEDREKWVDFERSLLGISSVTGNCIIVTTRSESVASIVGPLVVHKLRGLSKDDCWSIIKAKAFREEDNYPLEFEATGENVAEKCGGSPLAANVVGGLLVGKSKDEWMSIEKDWLGDENPIKKILKLSYDNLPSPLVKKCFAYCSMFPKGRGIRKEQLIELWMEEGFIQTLDFDGNRIFNLLRHNSLLQVHEIYDNGYVTYYCNMHDLVHDLAYHILYENDVMDGDCRRRYIGYNRSGDGMISIPKGQEKYVRTLFFDGKISDMRFSDFESLRTLIFFKGEEYITELPTSIKELKHLRYLDISETRIKYLPDSIGELYHLQTLRAIYITYRIFIHGNFLEKLPDSMSCLISLRHLHISYDRITFPPWIGKLISLQTLSRFCVGGGKGPGIWELGNLKDLKGKLEIRNLENVRHKDEASSAELFKKAGIYELKFVWEGSKENDESVLEGLKPHPNLKKLEICGFKGKRLPRWEGLINLVEIKLEECSKCEELPMLGHLPHLKCLYLSGLANVKSIGSSVYGHIDNCRRDTIVIVFPMLERLELDDMPKLEEWDDGVLFPRLKYLMINKCMQLRRAPSDFPCLEELEIKIMESSLPLENICGIKLTSLTRLIIQEIKGLECLPDCLFSNNPNLTELNIYDCPKMRHLVPHLGGAGVAPSLEELRIFRCPNLKSIISSGGGQQQGFTSLRELYIHDCTELIILPIEMVCAPSLEMLELNKLSSITNFPMVMGCLHKMTHLRKLDIRDCPSLIELPDDLHRLNSLVKLSIIGCRNLKLIRTSGGGQQQGFTSLGWLDISYCKALTNLPIEMVCAPSLYTLELDVLSSITNMGMVIASLHKMTSLRTLKISEAPKFSIPITLNDSLSLQDLEIGPSKSWNNVSFNETVGAMLLQCISLRSLQLRGMEHWDCLPSQLQHLTSLERLQLYDFGMEALPEWFGNLESLKDLRLSDCEKLRHLPSKQAMLRLSDLYMDECPLLLEKNDDDDDYYQKIVDSEWNKISHIPTVKMNGVQISSDSQGRH